MVLLKIPTMKDHKGSIKGPLGCPGGSPAEGRKTRHIPYLQPQSKSPATIGGTLPLPRAFNDGAIAYDLESRGN